VGTEGAASYIEFMGWIGLLLVLLLMLAAASMGWPKNK